MLTVTKQQILEAFDSLDLSEAESFLRQAKASVARQQVKKYPRVRVEIVANSAETAQVIANQIIRESANYDVGEVKLLKQVDRSTWESVEVEVFEGNIPNPAIKTS
jgi:hypothetical protein